MKSAMLLAVSVALFGIKWPSLPSFDWQAALIVGAIVAVGTVLVISVAIATPFIAIQAGATILGTCVAVSGIALTIGVIAGLAAGFYWGRQGDIKRQEQIESIKRVSNQLDIHFEPSADPKRAADFQCTLVLYEETDLAARHPTVTMKTVKIIAANSEDFYGQVDQQMKTWFTKQVAGDIDGQPRRVIVYMNPYPGEGIYERIRQMAEKNEVRKCLVNKVEGAWVSALP
ncbi:MAG: hypothetical protein NZM29_00580 [Nitrospira sp.]|nr:hypothetical protein [Nitrospira sp.]